MIVPFSYLVKLAVDGPLVQNFGCQLAIPLDNKAIHFPPHLQNVEAVSHHSYVAISSLHFEVADCLLTHLTLTLVDK